MLTAPCRQILMVQLPIPPLGPAPIRGNVPLAGAYLKLFAGQKGLESFYDIQLFPPTLANTLGDQAMASAIVEQSPWMVGFTCYVWNIERTLALAGAIKRRLPQVRIVLGGPEITPDNAWVLDDPSYDFAVIGEGEQTFAQLLLGIVDEPVPPVPIPGLYVPPDRATARFELQRQPAKRTPLPDINVLGSPYVAGVVDAADEQMMLLETTRGCVFKCKFCYYPKSYDKQYYLEADHIRAGLLHAQSRGAREVFLLDPTLNQRKDFADLLGLLAEGNPDHRFTYFGELRAEGITPVTARLLREANFTEVEIGLQSIDPEAQEKMDRKNNLRAFERGVRAIMAEGIHVKVDLIIGLPGDTVESVRRGMKYLRDEKLYSDMQVFNLAILPGTAFRLEAEQLGIRFQPRPPYYVLSTPTLRLQELYQLMDEAREIFELEFDAQPRPVLDFDSDDLGTRVWHVDLDVPQAAACPEDHNQAFTLWLRSTQFHKKREHIIQHVRHILAANPFTTLQIVLEPRVSANEEALPDNISIALLQELLAACQEPSTYLDRYYSMQPGRSNGAKRIILILPARARNVTDVIHVARRLWAISRLWCGDFAARGFARGRRPGCSRTLLATCRRDARRDPHHESSGRGRRDLISHPSRSQTPFGNALPETPFRVRFPLMTRTRYGIFNLTTIRPMRWPAPVQMSEVPARDSVRETEFRRVRSQTEFGNEISEGTSQTSIP